MSHIVPIDGIVIGFTDDGTSTATQLKGKISAVVSFRKPVNGEVKLRTYVNKVEKDDKLQIMIESTTMQSDNIAVDLPLDPPIEVACVAQFIHDGRIEGQYGAVTLFSPKAEA